MATVTGYIISSVDNKFNVDSSGNVFVLTDTVVSGDIYSRGNIVVTSNQTGIYTGSFYPLNSNPSNYITSSATGAYVTTGDPRDINFSAGNLIHGEEVQKFGNNSGYYYPNIFSYIANQAPAATTGAWVFHTPIPSGSKAMSKFRLHGYLYDNSEIVDSTIGGYTYYGVGHSGNISGSGCILNPSAIDNGNDGLSKWIGINRSGYVALALGDTGTVNGFSRISVDAWITSSIITQDFGLTGFLSGWSFELQTGVNFGWGDKNSPTGYEWHYHDASTIGAGTLPSGRLAGNYPGITGIGNATIGGNSIVTSNQTGVFATSANLASTGNTIALWTGTTTGLYYPYVSNPSNYATTGETGAFVRKNDFILKSPIGVTSSVDWQNRLLIDASGNNSVDWTNHYLTGGWVVGSLNSLGTISGGNIISDKNAYGAGIYTFYKGINSGATTGIFSIGNTASGAQSFMALMASSNTGFYVSKTYNVVHFYSGTPMVSLLSNTGPYNGRDFAPSFSDVGGTGVKLTINNNSTISGDFVVSVFLGGSFTPMIVSEL